MISSAYYLDQQQKLGSSKWYRRFWEWWGIYVVIVIFAISVYLILTNKWRELLLALAAFVLARAIISPLIYVFYKQERPYQRLNFTPIHSWLFSEPTSRHNSFPSDHAASFSAITLVWLWYFPVLGGLMILVSLMNSWARMVLGYHYPSHILAGWLVGLISGLMVIYWLGPLVFT